MKTLRPMSRLADITTGHGCYAPSVGITASANVMINGLPAHKVGDSFTPHTCPPFVTSFQGSMLVQNNWTPAASRLAYYIALQKGFLNLVNANP